MSTASRREAPSFNAPELRAEIARLREVDNLTNLGYLAFEYLCLASVIGATAAFAENRGSLGIAWGWNIPVFALAIVLIGGLQHRLAGLGHEASHYSLLRNKRANDLVGDLFCFFPILATVHFYRLFHLAHHQFTNDPALDPDLVNLGPGKCVADFPMARLRFILTRMLAPLISPLSFVQYQWEYFYVNTLGKGANVYMKRVPDGDAWDPRPRVGTILGVAYLLAAIAIQNILMRSGPIEWLLPAGLIGIGLVASVSYLLPDRWVFHSPFRQAYSERFAGALRLSTYTAALVALGWLYVRDRRAILALSLSALVRPAADDLPLFHAPAQHLPAHQRGRRPADQHPGLPVRPVHALGRLRLRAGHARPASPVPGGPALRAGEAPPAPDGASRGLRPRCRRGPRDLRQPGRSPDDPRYPEREGPALIGFEPGRELARVEAGEINRSGGVKPGTTC